MLTYEYIRSILDEELSRRAKPDTQTVAWLSPEYYSAHTQRLSNDGQQLFQPWVPILTPYAGDGYGMVCLPRIAQRVICLPLANKNDSTIAIGRIFQSNERPPQSDPGDFVIHHETHSQLLFKYTQPKYKPTLDGTDGEILKLEFNESDSSRTQRGFFASFKDSGYGSAYPFLQLREGDLIYVELDHIQFLNAVANSGKSSGIAARVLKGTGAMDIMPQSLQWIARVISVSNKKARIIISTENQTYGPPLYNYSDPAFEGSEGATDGGEKFFNGIRLAPMKGSVTLSHYTGSRLSMNEYLNFAHYQDTKKRRLNDELNVVPFNVNAVVGPRAYKKKEDGSEEIITPHAPKGVLELEHYSGTGIFIGEKEHQLLAHAVRAEFNLQKDRPIMQSPKESIVKTLPGAQIVMEDITQDRRDVATQAFFRQMSSATLSDESFESEKHGYTPILILQAEKGHYGVDDFAPDEVTLEGSGWFVQDYLKRYDERDDGTGGQIKGWRFASLKEARKQYRRFNHESFYAIKDGKDTYEIDFRDRVIPASGRRDIMIARASAGDEDGPPDQFKSFGEGEDDARLINFIPMIPSVPGKNEGDPDIVGQDAKGAFKITAETKEFVGQKGYTYKAWDDKVGKTKQDGYLCNPKGEVAFKHYTRSGVVIREIDPDIDYHAMHASFSLYNWDLGQYHSNHKFSEQRDSDDMKFGPYPLPVAQMIMESAKFEGEVEEDFKDEAADEIKADEDAVRDTLDEAADEIEDALDDIDDEIEDLTGHSSNGLLGTELGEPVESPDSWDLPRDPDPFDIPYDPESERKNLPPVKYPDENASVINPIGTQFNSVLEEPNTTERQPSFVPTVLVAHTHHPQPRIWKKDESRRRTLSTYGETGTWMGLLHRSSHIQKIDKEEAGTSFGEVDEDISDQPPVSAEFDHSRTGNRLLFKDYVIHADPDTKDNEAKKTPLISAAKWKNERGQYKRKLLAPKGSLELQHYTESGLAIYDRRLHYLNEYGGGHAMAMRLSMRSIEFKRQEDDDTPAPLFEVEDSAFFSKMLSNERVDDEDYKYDLIGSGKYPRAWSEEGSQRGKRPNKPHGKRGAITGIYHGTTLTKEKKYPCMMFFEDYIIPVTKEGKDYDTEVVHSGHVYGEWKDDKKTRKLLMPKGHGSFLLYNNSQLDMGDAEKAIDERIEKPDLIELPGKKQRAYTTLTLNEWNNQKIEEERDGMKPYDDESAEFAMKGIANVANYYGKDATRVYLSAYSSKSKNTKVGNSLMYEDYTIPDSDGMRDSGHIYEDDVLGGDPQKRKALLFPKGALGLQLFNTSGLFLQDKPSRFKDAQPAKEEILIKTAVPKLRHEVSDQDVADENVEYADGQKQSATLQLKLHEWNNRKIPANDSPAKPYDEQSAELVMSCIADAATFEGKDATWVTVNAWSSKIKQRTYGSALAFIDFTKAAERDGTTSAHIYKEGGSPEKRLELTFPKGRNLFQLYNESGLFIEDKEKKDGDKQTVFMKMAMHEWDNTKVPNSGEPFPEDSCTLEMWELLPHITKKGWRASRNKLESYTSSASGQPSFDRIATSRSYGSNVNIEDFLDGDRPSHIFDSDGGGQRLCKPIFPKGKIETLHYNQSGLIIEDLETQHDAGKQRASIRMRLRQWGDASAPEGEDLALLYAFDTTPERQDKLAVHVGFLHNSTSSRFYAIDQNEKKGKHKMECGITHWGSPAAETARNIDGRSYLKFMDVVDENRQVDIKLYHKKDSYLRMFQKDPDEDNMLVKLYHTKNTYFEVDNQGDDVTLTIFHKSGSQIVIDKDGNINITGVKNMTANIAERLVMTAGKSAVIRSPSIMLDGRVTVTEDLIVANNIDTASITSGAYNNASGNQI